MRIAFFAITLGIEAKGGELYVHQLANALSSRGHEVLVLSGGPPLPDARYQVRRLPVPFRLKNLSVGPLAFSLRSGLARARRASTLLFHHAFMQGASAFLARFRPDILVPLFMRPELWYARLARRALGCRLVSVGHGPSGDDALALGSVDAFVATSPRQEMWARYFEVARVELIPVGVDTTRFSPEKTPAVLSLPRPVFLQVGSLLPVKRPRLSIEALSRLGRGSLLVVGEGPLEKEIDLLGWEKLGARYLRIPRLSHEELSSYYRAADALLFPSDTGETAGLVMLEALASGTPVVASDDETRRWLVGEAAVLVDPTDPDAFARGIEEALRTPDRARLRKYAEKFSWEAIAARHEALYEAIENRK